MSPLSGYVLQSLVTLLGIVALAVLVLYGARHLGVGRPSGPLHLVGRLPLDGRRVVYLVRAGSRTFVLGGSEAGLATLGELSEVDAVEGMPPPKTGFSNVLSRVLGHKVKESHADQS